MRLIPCELFRALSFQTDSVTILDQVKRSAFPRLRPLELSSPALQTNHGDEARDEGDEGHEGNEGHEEEGGRVRGRHISGDEEEGHEGHEGHEGQVSRKRSEEGHKGHEGNVSRKRPILPFVGYRVRVKPNI